ncbi:LysR family transcriptional regulator [Sneathiella limimaris]|uniref:LysR family transcriptional regulator n=1 Tax=Sneathiella limimaris TaxID=1964213 RepID=UPI00146B2F3C|nr:LysR family transcriptional regulator [Sneathiella limimaris]
MTEPDWELLKSFLHVYREKSLSAAARALGKTQPTIGRHIELLEDALATNLFTRTSTGLLPTEQAHKLLDYVNTIENSVKSLVRSVAETTTETPSGIVRLTASKVIGVEVLPPLLKKFQDEYPLIQIELVLTNKTENLLKRESDLAIRMTRPTQGDLIAHKIADTPIGFFASKDYVETHGTPEGFEDFKDHIGIGPDKAPHITALLAKTPFKSQTDLFSIRTDDEIAQHQLIRNGAGIGGMQVAIAERDPNLVHILSDQFHFPMEVWIAMHHSLRSSKPVHLLFSFLKTELGDYFKAP